MKRSTIVSIIDALTTVGLFIILFLVVRTYYQAVKNFEAIREAQVQNAQQAEKRDDVIISYLKCIALIKPEDRTEANVQECVDTAKTPASTSPNSTSNTTVPQSLTNETGRAEPTTSTPPEPGMAQRVGEQLTNIGNDVNRVIKKVLGD